MPKAGFDLSEYDELIKELKKVPEKVAIREVQGIIRKAAEPAKKAIIAAAPEESGELKRAVTIKRVKSARDLLMVLTIKTRGKFWRLNTYVRQLEFGGVRVRKHKSGKSVGIIPAQPFFYKAYRSVHFTVKPNMIKGMESLIKRKLKRLKGIK